jgi:murein DD-endopeptidase MepM/ murein hydrolase activator NlpD
VSNGALLATGPAGEDEVATSRLTNGEIRVYTVRPGDSLSQIAEMFQVTTNTILWANDITDPTTIQPGDSLVILPIVGVQHTVKSGDTVESIAQDYEGDADEILAYNQLDSTAELTVGETVVIPGGRIEESAAPTQVADAPTPVRQSGSVSSSNGLSHPAPGTVRTQGIHGYNAVDFGAPIGTPILAAAAGEVIVSKPSGWNGGYGAYVVIRHPNGTQTLYAHNSQNYVGVGEYVSAGQTIAAMGDTGRSTGPHLHFEVRGTANPF